MAKKRKDFKDCYKWNIKDLYTSDKEALKELDNLNKEIDRLTDYQGHILDSAKSLEEVLKLDTEVGRKLERLYIYGHINNDADTLDENYQELFGKIKNVYTKYLEVSSFMVPELLESDYEVVENFIKENSNLLEFERLLKHIFRNKEHILSKEVESVLSSYAKLMDAPDEIMGALTDSDFKFDSIMVDGKKVELTESNYSVYLRYHDRSVRKQAFESLYKTYRNFKTTLASILKAEVDKSCVNAKLRGFKSSLECALFSNEIDPAVYHNLVLGFKKEFIKD